MNSKVNKYFTNLLDFYNDIDMYGNSRSIDIIYLGLQKTLDNVPHNRLLSKVHTHGITGNIQRRLEDCLSGR